MALRLGDQAPDFTAQTTEGTISLYDYLGDSWGILFSHPKDFTPVCTTELGAFSARKARLRQAQHEAPRPLRGLGQLPRRLEGRHRRDPGARRSTSRSSPTRTARSPTPTT